MISTIANNPKKILTGVVLVAGCIGLGILRGPQMYHCVLDEYNSKKPTELRLFTGECMMNWGTAENPNWVQSKRGVGVASGEGEMDADMQ